MPKLWTCMTAKINKHICNAHRLVAYLLHFLSRSFLSAPTTSSICWPSLMNKKVGIARTSYSAATSWTSSTSTFTKISCPNLLLNSAKTGAMSLQGPHQDAVKSTTITFLAALASLTLLCQARLLLTTWTLPWSPFTPEPEEPATPPHEQR